MPNRNDFSTLGPKGREQLSLDAQKARRAQIFFVGQIVRLRCGGPLMTVEGPAPIGPGPDAAEPAKDAEMGVQCCWFTGGQLVPGGNGLETIGGQLCRERFAVALLVNCDPEHGASRDGELEQLPEPEHPAMDRTAERDRYLSSFRGPGR